MLPGTTETECFPRTVFAVIFINQIVSVHISDVCFIQLFFVISAADNVYARVIGVIINAIIVKGHQHTFVDGVFQRNLIGNIVVADFVNIPPVKPLGCCRQPQQKLRFEIFYDPPVLVIDCMMKFIDHQIIKIVRRKIFFVQIGRPAQRCH
mgnify:CR=1 FL=1